MSLAKLRAAWEEVHRQQVEFQRGPYEFPDDRFWDALDGYVALYNSLGAHWAMGGQVEHAHTKLVELLLARDQEDDARVNESVWYELKAIQDWYDFLPMMHRLPHAVQPIKKLMSIEGMTTEGVAKHYGFINPHSGRGEAHLIEQEIDEPGSVITEDWVHPKELERRKLRAQLEEDLAEETEAGAPEIKVSVLTKYADLGLSAHQIAGVLGKTVDAVREAADEMGLKLPGDSEEIQPDGPPSPDELTDDFQVSEPIAEPEVAERPTAEPGEPSWALGLDAKELREYAASLGVAVHKNANRAQVIKKVQVFRDSVKEEAL